MIAPFAVFSKVACDGRHKFLFELQRAANAPDGARTNLARAGQYPRSIPVTEPGGHLKIGIAQTKLSFASPENREHGVIDHVDTRDDTE